MVNPFAKGGSDSFYYSDTCICLVIRSTQARNCSFQECTPATRRASTERSNIRPPRAHLAPSNERTLAPGDAKRMRLCRQGSGGIRRERRHAADLLALACIANSRAFTLSRFVSSSRARSLAQSYEVGLIQTTPVPDLFCLRPRRALAGLARRAWSLKRWIDTRTETSHAFSLPALLQVSGADIAARTAAWSEHVRAVETEVAAMQTEIDQRCFVLYGIDEADHRAITEGLRYAAH